MYSSSCAAHIHVLVSAGVYYWYIVIVSSPRLSFIVTTMVAYWQGRNAEKKATSLIMHLGTFHKRVGKMISKYKRGVDTEETMSEKIAEWEWKMREALEKSPTLNGFTSLPPAITQRPAGANAGTQVADGVVCENHGKFCNTALALCLLHTQ